MTPKNHTLLFIFSLVAMVLISLLWFIARWNPEDRQLASVLSATTEKSLA